MGMLETHFVSRRRNDRRAPRRGESWHRPKTAARSATSPRSPLTPLRTIQPANHRRPGDERRQRALNVGKVLNRDELAGFIETDQITHPRKGRNIGNRVLIAENPLASFQTLLQHAEQ